MAEFPALTLWTDAYLSDTRRLSTLEHGAYLLLLMEAWRRPHCDLPDDDKILARLAGLSAAEWDDIKAIVMGFWKFDGRSKTWSQKRLTLERNKARKRSKSQSDKASKRWDKTENVDAGAMPDECPDDASTATAIDHKEEEEGKPSPSPNASASVRSGRSKGIRKQGVDLPLPDDWTPNLGEKAQSIVDGWPPGKLDREELAFRSHAEANGRVAKNWDAAFRTWIVRGEEQRIENGNRQANGRPASGFAERDRRDGTTRAIDRLGGFDRPRGSAEAVGQPDAGDGSAHRQITGTSR